MDTRVGRMDTHMVYCPRVLNSLVSMLEGCLVRSHKMDWILEHFMYRHWKYHVVIL